MSNDPVDPRIRLAIARWPADAPRGAVTSFCREHAISRNTFYKLRRRAASLGEAAVLEPLSRRPRSSPTALGQDVKDQALAVRASLASSGLDNGPVSVHDKMESMGLDAPCPAALARLFRQRGVSRREPDKRPRSAWRRFVYPAPNACWQMDATQYVLTGGRKCVIFQLIDDHSRLALASLVAEGETSAAAIATFDTAVERHGVPQRLLTDNGAALNPTRRGFQGALVAHVQALGVEPITGKPHKPTTQGKNERFHRTLFRYLDAHPLANDLAGLQALVDTFDQVYNNERGHQALPGRITPAQAWAATPAAEPPRPKAGDEDAIVPGGAPGPTEQAAQAAIEREATVEQTAERRRRARARFPEHGEQERRIGANGAVSLANTVFLVSRPRSGQIVTACWDPTTVWFVDTAGEVITQYPWPDPTVRYVSHHDPATKATRGGRPRKNP